MRYEIQAIADADCKELTGEILASSNDSTEAHQLADNISAEWIFGVAIFDTETKLTDWGYGFGIPIPDREDFEFFCNEHQYGWRTTEDGRNEGCPDCRKEEE